MKCFSFANIQLISSKQRGGDVFRQFRLAKNKYLSVNFRRKLANVQRMQI